MSQQLISRSPDLKRLRDEGYSIVVRDGFLVIGDVPYVATDRQVRRGVLVSELTLAGDVTSRPSTHVVTFSGDLPCDRDGNVLSKIISSSEHQELAQSIRVDHSFSSKPTEGYADYYEKMTTYIRILSGPAAAIDPSATAKVFNVVSDEDDAGVFNYVDTASSRARIGAIAGKLALAKIAIIGLGGTGAYVLDLVAKTLVGEIHLFDGDLFLQHNAFRSPGAPSADELRAQPYKVSYFAQRYSAMRKGIVEHAYFVDSSNIDELSSMDFVFICVDSGSSRKVLVDALEEFKVAFVDVGMGVEAVDDQLGGLVRVSASSPGRQKDADAKKRMPLTDNDVDDEYASNIQIADLNALNAALAVIRWKKMCGFYRDLEGEFFTVYTIDGNHLTNDDLSE